MVTSVEGVRGRYLPFLIAPTLEPGQAFWTPTSLIWVPGSLLQGMEVAQVWSHFSSMTHLEPWHPRGPWRAWRADGRALLENREVRPLPDKQQPDGSSEQDLDPEISMRGP